MDARVRNHPFTTPISGQSLDDQWPSLTIRGLSMNASWTVDGQQQWLGPDGQDPPRIVQGQKNCPPLRGTVRDWAINCRICPRTVCLSVVIRFTLEEYSIHTSRSCHHSNLSSLINNPKLKTIIQVLGKTVVNNLKCMSSFRWIYFTGIVHRMCCLIVVCLHWCSLTDLSFHVL